MMEKILTPEEEFKLSFEKFLNDYFQYTMVPRKRQLYNKMISAIPFYVYTEELGVDQIMFQFGKQQVLVNVYWEDELSEGKYLKVNHIEVE